MLPFVLMGRLASADVDESCFTSEEVLCARSRAGDAKAGDRYLEATLASAGWSKACYSIMYLAGDNGGPDAMSIALHGVRGSTEQECLWARDEHSTATKAQLRDVAARVKRALTAGPQALCKHTDVLQITNGWDGDVRLRLP